MYLAAIHKVWGVGRQKQVRLLALGVFNFLRSLRVVCFSTGFKSRLFKRAFDWLNNLVTMSLVRPLFIKEQ